MRKQGIIIAVWSFSGGVFLVKQDCTKYTLKKSTQYRHNELKIQGEALKWCCFNKQWAISLRPLVSCFPICVLSYQPGTFNSSLSLISGKILQAFEKTKALESLPRAVFFLSFSVCRYLNSFYKPTPTSFEVVQWHPGTENHCLG